MKENKEEEFKEILQNVQAEFENYKKRQEKEREKFAENEKAKVLADFLSVLDAINSGIKQEPENNGLKKVKEQLVQALHSYGVQKIPLKKGNSFNHETMECISKERKEEMEGKVLEILQKGYFLKDKVLRHAKVIIGDSEKGE